ncbi:MAG: BrnT family toxin [Nitrospira sp.]|nr:BrnT family toxin [Nitrospira sp.]
MTIDDPRHSTRELRWVTLGHSVRHRLLAVVHTDRGRRIRIISAHVARVMKGRPIKKAKRERKRDMLSEYDLYNLRLPLTDRESPPGYAAKIFSFANGTLSINVCIGVFP